MDKNERIQKLLNDYRQQNNVKAHSVEEDLLQLVESHAFDAGDSQDAHITELALAKMLPLVIEGRAILAD